MRPKFMLFVICIETAIICFFLFSFFLHIHRFKPKFQPVFAPIFSKEIVYNTFNLDSQQKVKYDKILSNFYKVQIENENKKRENFPKLHNLIATPNANKNDIDKLTAKQTEIFETEILNSTNYLTEFKSILNENQKNLFCDLLKNKEMHKIMPPAINENPRVPPEHRNEQALPLNNHRKHHGEHP